MFPIRIMQIRKTIVLTLPSEYLETFVCLRSCQKMSFRYVCFQEHVTVRRNIIPLQKIYIFGDVCNFDWDLEHFYLWLTKRVYNGLNFGYDLDDPG